MKTIFILFGSACMALCCLLSFTSCNKSGSSVPASRFTWTYDGTLYVAKQDTARLYNVGGSTIIAGLQAGLYAPGSGPRMTLTGLQTGTYSFATGTGNTFVYIDTAGFNIPGFTGSLNITRNANSLLEGNFSLTLFNSKIITGEFSNTPIK